MRQKQSHRRKPAQWLAYAVCVLCVIGMGGIYVWRTVQGRTANAQQVSALFTALTEHCETAYLQSLTQMGKYGESLLQQEADRIEAARLEQERLERERLEKERLERERLEQERLEQERLERERLERERQERERQRILALEQAADARVTRRLALVQSVAAAKQLADSQKNLPKPPPTPAETAAREALTRLLNEQGKAALAQNADYQATKPKAIVALSVPVIYQRPSLPNGCEITSLAMLLQYQGFPVSRETLADNYLPQFPMFQDENGRLTCANPSLYFCGNPRDESNAYYCFAEPIVDAANAYLADVGSSLRGRDMTGATEAQLIKELQAGNPVAVWGTLSMGEPISSKRTNWYCTDDGTTYLPYSNLHCLVLTGYDNRFFYFSDPLRGEFAYYRSNFMAAYQAMGARAVAIVKPEA